MGKYNHALDSMNDENKTQWLLHDICEELAEANRLKRLELRLLTIDFKHDFSEELEDKA